MSTASFQTFEKLSTACVKLHVLDELLLLLPLLRPPLLLLTLLIIILAMQLPPLERREEVELKVPSEVDHWAILLLVVWDNLRARHLVS